MHKLTAVILVGGPGTRLQPLTDAVPKSMVPVLNRPVMEHTIAYLKQFGVEDIVLTLSYLPDAIRDYFGDGQRFGVRIAYCLEEEPLGTAGAVKNAEAHLKSTFIVLNGDVFTDLDLAGMLAFHRQNKAAATISLSWVEDTSAFGVVETDNGQRVKSFIEKPPRAEATTNWINAGTYILDPAVLEHIPAGRHYMFEKGLFPGLLSLGAPVYGYPYRGYWLDMGTLEKYFNLNMDLLSSRFNSPLGGLAGAAGIGRGADVVLHPSAEITPPVLIDRGCRIGPRVRLKGPVVLGRDCRLEQGAAVESAVLWEGVGIGAGASLNRCIVSSRAFIGSNRAVENCVVTPSRTVPLSG